MAMLPVPVPVLATHAEPESSKVSHLAPDPAHCQWSRTAFAACLRDGELNLYVRDDALRGEREIVSVLKQALRDTGIRLGEIKVNGIHTAA